MSAHTTWQCRFVNLQSFVGSCFGVFVGLYSISAYYILTLLILNILGFGKKLVFSLKT